MEGARISTSGHIGTFQFYPLWNIQQCGQMNVKWIGLVQDAGQGGSWHCQDLLSSHSIKTGAQKIQEVRVIRHSPHMKKNKGLNPEDSDLYAVLLYQMCESNQIFSVWITSCKRVQGIHTVKNCYHKNA